MEEKERIAWVINWIETEHPEHKRFNDFSLSKMWGIDDATVKNYRNKKGIPKGPVWASLVKDFGINGEWLISGAGEPFPGARDKYPEACGSPGYTQKQYDQVTESVHYQIKDAQMQYSEEIKQPTLKASREFRISDALTMCTRVLESGTSYATALYFNIEHFDRAVKSEFNELKYQADLLTVNKTLSDMQTRMDELESNNKKLREEIKTMQGLSGDCAPINLNMENAAPTGTDDKGM
ncbi:MAG: hypothetical protein ABFD76_09015 [Smithella sp.]